MRKERHYVFIGNILSIMNVHINDTIIGKNHCDSF